MTVPSQEFWRGRRVLLTGHTGFKGAWAALWLARLGAEVHGFARAPESEPSLHGLIRAKSGLASERIASLSDPVALRQLVSAARPEIILHMAAQSLVRRALADPAETFRTNVMGTVQVLEAARRSAHVRTILVVTSDKVYANSGDGSAFGEEAPLGGKDPYSASKAACELVVASYRQSFFARHDVRIATVRGGNVIGGGDFSADRLVPDAVRAALSGQELVLRHPEATRPWQHVLDCLSGYLVYAEALHRHAEVPEALNIGPPSGERMTVSELAGRIMAALDATGRIRHEPEPGSMEMPALAIDASLARRTLGWRETLTMTEAADWTATWYRAWRRGAPLVPFMLEQIARYRGLAQ